MAKQNPGCFMCFDSEEGCLYCEIVEVLEGMEQEKIEDEEKYDRGAYTSLLN